MIGPTELLILTPMLLAIFPFWKIFRKAGFSPWLSLLFGIPVFNIGLLFYLGFAEWPALKRSS